jgi:hypothetical protein
LAAEPAELAPRALMIAAPRCCTVEMNSPCSHAVSLIVSVCGLAVDARVGVIGILRRRVIAPDRDAINRRHIDTGFLRQLCLGAVLVQARHGIPAVARHFRRVVHRDQAVGVARIAHHEYSHIAGGIGLNRFALPVKMLPLMPSKSLRSMPCLRGTLPMSSAQLTPLNLR